MRTLIPLLLSVCLLSACDSKNTNNNAASQKQETSETQTALLDFAAHWQTPKTLFIKKSSQAQSLRLHYSLDAAIGLSQDAIDVNESPSFGLVEDETAVIPEVFAGEYIAVRPDIKVNEGALKLILKGQVVVVQKDEAGKVVRASQVQFAKLLDALYTSGDNDADEVTDFGATTSGSGVTFKVWAPTARSVEVLLFDHNKNPMTPASLEMVVDGNTGVWTALGDASLNLAFYQYKITVYHPGTNKVETAITTDPYSLSLSTNSEYSQVVSLQDDVTLPGGWDTQEVPTLANYEDSILYETHIRDFSASDKNLSNKRVRGKYKAFSEKDSDGIKHLKALRNAGLTHIHLLPAFDIATVNEDPEQTVYQDDTLEKACRIIPDLALCETEDKNKVIQDILESYDPSTGDAQALIEGMRRYDGYNWGYDPYHYTVPEGSYAINAEGVARIVEFREMVQAIHGMGFRVVMDVVYNHTFSNQVHNARLGKYAVLDTLVPNYYNRLNLETGNIETSTCCHNTATEHVMMGKLMVDSLVIWARDYKIDGFRFDLMGHQPKDLMLVAYDKVREVDADTYFYGEGWNFGEVANNRLFVQAIQTELGGTEIGTFTDRMRDSIRGGSFSDGGMDVRRGQGLSSGIYSLPNELQGEDKRKEEYLLSLDQARIGLAGNLANYPLIDRTGTKVTGKGVPYGGAPTGYALDPADTVNYVSKHDNQTLWDSNQYRLAYDTSTEDRVRFQNIGLAYAMFSQGIPFIHMGSELLRSKSFLRDSYDFNDWFNAVDFGMQSNNYNVGLPPAGKDEANWPLISEVLKNNEGRDLVKPEHIKFAAEVFKEWLQIRSGSPLFRLTTEQEVIDRVKFHNTGPNQQEGIIAMQIDDASFEKDLDKNYENIMVIFNHSGVTRTIAFADAAQYRLHPVQARGVDEQIKSGSSTSDKGFVVPALSVAIFVN